MTDETLVPIPREARPYQGHRAGLVSRLLANAVDAVVVVMILIAAYVGLNVMRFFLDPRGFRLTEPRPLFTVTTGLVVLALYLAIAWAVSGRTYGCHVMGLRVVGPGGGRVRAWVALARGTLSALFPIGLFWCAFSRRKSSLQDVLLRTSVIYDWTPRHDRAGRSTS